MSRRVARSRCLYRVCSGRSSALSSVSPSVSLKVGWGWMRRAASESGELFRFRDDVGCDGRDHVHAEHDPDAGLLRADAADERQRSAGVAHHHAGVGHHRVHGLLDIGEVVALFRVGRGQSDAGGLGVREHDLRDGVLIERLWIESGDGFRGDDALLERAVSERVPFGDVADGPYACDRRAAVSVGRDESMVVDGHAGVTYPTVGGQRIPPDRDEHEFAFGDVLGGAAVLGAGVVHEGSHVDAGVDVGHRRAVDDVDAVSFELTRQGHAGAAIPSREHTVLADKHRDLASGGVPHGGEFGGDRARADDDRVVRHRHRHRPRRIDDRATERLAGQLPRDGSHGEHHVLSGDVVGRADVFRHVRAHGPLYVLPVSRCGDVHGDGTCRAGDRGDAPEHGDAPMGEQTCQPLRHRVDDALLVIVQRPVVDAVDGGGDAQFAGVPDGVDCVGGADQRLRRDAPAVEAGSAERCVAFDHGHAFAELGRPQSCGISAGSTADYRDVKSFTHVRLLCARTKTIPIVIPYARRRAELWSK